MNRACIAVVDATRARLYTYQHDPERQLREAAVLLQPSSRDVVAAIDRIVREGAYAHVIVVASPTTLGELCEVGDVLHRADLVLDVIPRDLAKLRSPQLHDRLAELELIPPRQRPAFAVR